MLPIPFPFVKHRSIRAGQVKGWSSSRPRADSFRCCGDRDEDIDLRIKRCLVARHELRGASIKGTLRAFRYADRFTTFKIFRRPGALRRRVAPGQSRRSDRIGGPNGAGKSTLFALLLDRPLLGISNGADTISLLNATTGAIWSNRRVQIAVITIAVSVALLVSAKRFYGAR